MNKTFTPLRYPGGKSQFYDCVVKIIVENNLNNITYIEPFAGGAGVAMRLLIEGLVDSIVINDLDYAIFAFWYTVLNDTDWLIESIERCDINIETWKIQKKIYLNPKEHSLKEVGFATFFLNRCNRSGILSAGPIGGKKQEGNYKIDCRFNKSTLISIIRMISLNKNRIKLFNLDATDLIRMFKNETDTLWFIDPPYFGKGEELYKNSFSPSDHKHLSRIINQYLNNQAWILTYDVCDDIFSLYNNHRFRKISLSYSVGSKRKEEEYLFFNNLKINKELIL